MRLFSCGFHWDSFADRERCDPSALIGRFRHRLNVEWQVEKKYINYQFHHCNVNGDLIKLNRDGTKQFNKVNIAANR